MLNFEPLDILLRSIFLKQEKKSNFSFNTKIILMSYKNSVRYQQHFCTFYINKGLHNVQFIATYLMQNAKSISLHMLHALLRRIIKNFLKNCWGKKISQKTLL